ncbi:MAG: RNA methyltransferase [Flavobacteriia bacterium]|nr:MAG: RNA methyltransferase [Flavobacteriia bacterium]
MTLKYIHNNLVLAVIGALEDIFNRNQYADKVVERVLTSNKKWGSRDRRFIAHAIYECVRWKRYYRHVDRTVRNTSTSDWYGVLAVYLIQNAYQLPQIPEFSSINAEHIHQELQNKSMERAVRESIPEWLDELGTQELGSQWDKEIKALNHQAGVVIRANTLKTTRDELQKQLKNEGIETEILKGYPDALKLLNRTKISHTKAFKEGLFEVQDASSQLVAPFLDVKPGDFVVDACAGGGGKALHLAALMHNKGKLLAMDIYPSKLNNLKKRAHRNAVTIVETLVVDNLKKITPWLATADKVLIDAPCSGLGVLRRNPDAKWKLNLQFIRDLENSQYEILESYAALVKTGGQVVYATCSILPSENESIIKKFLHKNKAYKFVKELKVSPAQSGYDGFYMALLEKTH